MGHRPKHKRCNYRTNQKNLKEKIFMTLAQAKILRQDTNVSTIKEKLINWINEN